MNPRRSLTWRVLLVTLLAGLLGTFSALSIGDRVIRHAFLTQLTPQLATRFDASEAAACATSPSSWSMNLWPAWGIRAYAYDLSSGRSLNPAAPPLHRELAARLDRKPRATAYELSSPGRRGSIMFRTDSSGPCGVVQARWDLPFAARRLALIVGGSATASAIGACWLSLVAIAFPLLRRIRKLRAAAARVGDAAGYCALTPPEKGDELDGLAEVLDRAHHRIRSDAQLLEQQRDALEKHLTHVAHDLRTPLTSLQVALEYASDLVREPEAREVLAGALRDTVYLAGLTQNLRLASQLRTGWSPMDETAPVDLTDLVERVAARARMLARRRNLALEISVPEEAVIVSCNAVAVEQALANLVDNAVAYGNARGHVAILLAVEESRTEFRLDVRDDGPGVPPEQLPRLGQATFRSDEARRRDPRGSGLGLAITSEICARLGWVLVFEALQPRGLCVRVSGPLARA